MASSDRAPRICLLTCHLGLNPGVIGWINALDDSLRARGFTLVLLSGNRDGLDHIPGLVLPFDQSACADAFHFRGATIPDLTSMLTARLAALGQIDTARVRDGLAACTGLAEILCDQLAPEAALVWGDTAPFSLLFRHVADDRGLPTWVMERGFYPGTLMLEMRGHASLSEWHASFALSHAAATVASGSTSVDATVDKPADGSADGADEEAIGFQAFRDYVLHTAPAKLPQPDPVPRAELRRTLAPADERLILFLGQWDPLAGLVPADSPTRRRHSPGFATTTEALDALVRAAAAIGRCRVALKPHPRAWDPATANRADLTVLTDVNLHAAIEAADVVVGQVTTSLCEALLFDRPIVSLGRNVLTGKGITYDCFRPEQVEATLRQALDRDDLPARRARGARFVTWLATHALIATSPEVPLARPMTDLAAFIEANALPANSGSIESRLTVLDYAGPRAVAR